MARLITDLSSCLDSLTKAVFSQPIDSTDYTKVTVRAVTIRAQAGFQVEQFRDNKAFHRNVTPEELLKLVQQELEGRYRQVLLVTPEQSSQYCLKVNGSYKKSVSAGVPMPAASRSHNREKSYILKEGENIPALVDLGVFTPDMKIVRAKYDKYKQINRFIELVDQAFRDYKKDEICILDFGCGKSYLTFILYYYFSVKRGLKATIIGYDLKADVVERCGKIAEKYGYTGLEFVHADVSRDVLADRKIDMIVTLHACDTATDYALDYAIRNRIPHILSVPCCQHEVNLSLRKGGELDIFQKHGIIKERMSALLTDALRAELMERCGYEVDVIEFVDLSHTPKNLMLRCRLRRSETPALGDLQLMQRRYGFSQTLLRLCCERAAGAGKAATYGDRGN